MRTGVRQTVDDDAWKQCARVEDEPCEVEIEGQDHASFIDGSRENPFVGHALHSNIAQVNDVVAVQA